MSEIIKKEEMQVQVVNDNSMGGVINLIQRVALNPDIDIDKIDRLFKMQMELLDRQALKEYNQSMAKAQGELLPVARDATNKHTASDYATLQAVIEAITPIVTKYGFSIEFGQGKCQIENHMNISYVIRHSEGHIEAKSIDVPIDKLGIAGKVTKTDTHAFGSTFSYGRRYALMLIFNIATRDNDGNNRPQQVVDFITGGQVKTLRELLDVKGRTVISFCDHYKVKSLTEFHAYKYDAAIKNLNSKPDVGVLENG